MEKIPIFNINIKENNIKLKHVFLLLISYFGSTYLIQYGFQLSDYFFNWNINDENIYQFKTYLNLTLNVFQILFALFIIYKCKLFVFKRTEYEHKNNWINGLFYSFYTFMVFMLPNLILTVFNNVNQETGQVTTNNQEILTKVTQHNNYYVMFIMSVIISPIIEELIFRAIPLYFSANHDFLNKKIFIFLRILIMSILFGYLHSPSNFVEWFSYSIVGLLLGLSVAYTNKIETGIFIHMVNNLLSFFAIIFMN